MKPELLAPAGSMEKCKMALIYGADAVYLGGKNFGLRAFAGNFSNEEIEEAVNFAHSMGKKVYVTVNIFPHNSDLIGLPEYLKKLAALHVDGLLISDLGIWSIARKTVPICPYM
jgi:putative protease